MDMVAFAYENGLSATKLLSREEQKRLGQYMTPPPIARMMAERTCAQPFGRQCVHILEPAAGTGVLAAAVIRNLLKQEEPPAEIHVHLFETDQRLRPALTRLADRVRREARRLGIQVKFRIQIKDFLLSDTALEHPQFDIVIANPPYFKLPKNDARAMRHAYAVYGQPNIYGLFMAACARLLKAGGRWCFITPRSWTNGPYFSMMRRQLLLHLHLDAMHVFESRQEHFTQDEILQEAMITWATCKAGTRDTVLLSTSEGISDLDCSILRTLPVAEVVSSELESTISLPGAFDSALQYEFAGTLSSFGLKVSTGPVVAFRASIHLSETTTSSTVPLLWMQHVQHMRICWPIKKKREHINANAQTAWMLVPNETMVVLRRFSPKEDVRRVTAAPYIKGSIPGEVVGLENHTNYIYRPGGHMSPDEAKGLAAFLNSVYVDSYLRSISGNTQVNAADLRGLPLPRLQQLIQMGAALPEFSTLRQSDFEVEHVLGPRQKMASA
jgi:adenine-specific DNA-methyltransferase